MFILKSTYNEIIEENEELEKEVFEYREVLKQIVAQETKAPNATVSRIIAIAKNRLAR